jgi:hypothetical protein
MVAYSFQRRFVAPIREGTKVHTIRRQRRRHARVGEELQLYHGMRTRHCELIGRKWCTLVLPVELLVQRSGIVEAMVDRQSVSDLDGFAARDGFADARDFGEFWLRMHGPGAFPELVLIGWGDGLDAVYGGEGGK